MSFRNEGGYGKDNRILHTGEISEKSKVGSGASTRKGDRVPLEATAVQSVRRSLALSNTRYEGGVTSYLEVITAQNAALSDEVTAVNILGRRMASAVLLVQALGGGWDRSNLPERPECCGKLAMNAN